MFHKDHRESNLKRRGWVGMIQFFVFDSTLRKKCNDFLCHGGGTLKGYTFNMCPLYGKVDIVYL